MASSISRLGIINFIGQILHSDNISAIDVSNDFLVIGADEGNQVQILKRQGEDYAVVSDITLNPSAKEIDIEGIVIHKQQLYIGFRGPVLRENWVPVLKCRFAKPVTEAELVYVRLDGLGFRDITRVEDGFLILAGPVGDGPGAFQVYFWDGEDCLPGIRASGKTGRVERLGVIPTAENAKAEGLTLLKESSLGYEVAIVFDGLKNGSPTRFGIAK
jgi:Protein of unknown function (DUF3616)